MTVCEKLRKGKDKCGLLQRRPGRVPGFTQRPASPDLKTIFTRYSQGRIIIAVHRAFVSGCEGPSICGNRWETGMVA